MSVAKYAQKPINPTKKSQNFTKVEEHMCHNMLKKHAKFHGDRTIGGAITVKKVSLLLGVQARSAENLL